MPDISPLNTGLILWGIVTTVLAVAAGIPASSQQPEAAKALIQWLASPVAYPAIKKSGLDPAKSK